MDKMALFRRVYANLPLGARSEIVLELNGQPMTWNVLYLEVENETPLAKIALDKLEKMGILNHEK